MNNENAETNENVYWLNDKAFWLTLYVPHAPMVTRSLGVNKHGRIYISEAYRSWKRFLVRLLSRALKQAPPPDRWEIQAVWYATGEATHDLDNALKPIIDACASVLRVDDKAHLCRFVSARYVNMLDNDENIILPSEPGLWMGLTCHYRTPFSLEQAAWLFPNSRLWEVDVPF